MEIGEGLMDRPDIEGIRERAKKDMDFMYAGFEVCPSVGTPLRTKLSKTRQDRIVLLAYITDLEQERDEWKRQAEIARSIAFNNRMDLEHELYQCSRCNHSAVAIVAGKKVCAVHKQIADLEQQLEELRNAHLERGNYVLELQQELREAKIGFTDYAETAGASLRELSQQLARAEKVVKAAKKYNIDGDPFFREPLAVALAEWEGK